MSWIAEAPELWVTIEGASTHVGPGKSSSACSPIPEARNGRPACASQGIPSRWRKGLLVASRSRRERRALGAAGVHVAITAPATCRGACSHWWTGLSPRRRRAWRAPRSRCLSRRIPARNARAASRSVTDSISCRWSVADQCTTAIAPSDVRLGPEGGSGSSPDPGAARLRLERRDVGRLADAPRPDCGKRAGHGVYAVQPNQGAARTGTARIAGQTLHGHTGAAGPVHVQRSRRRAHRCRRKAARVRWPSRLRAAAPGTPRRPSTG